MKGLLFLIFLLASFNVHALMTIPISWVAPTEREKCLEFVGDLCVKHEPLKPEELAGFRIYYGTAAGDYQKQIDINDRLQTNYVLKVPPAGDYYFVMTAIDTDGRESRYSEAVHRKFVAPSKPTFTIGQIAETVFFVL